MGFIAFAVTKNEMASKQIDSWTAGVYFGCRNVPSGPVTTDTARCLDPSADARGMARAEAYKKSHAVLW